MVVDGNDRAPRVRWYPIGLSVEAVPNGGTGAKLRGKVEEEVWASGRERLTARGRS
jgi:hypothetical protein